MDIIYRDAWRRPAWFTTRARTRTAACGPYVQSERQASGIYLEYAKKLIEKGEAYYCFCDKETIWIPFVRASMARKYRIYDKHCLPSE